MKRSFGYCTIKLTNDLKFLTKVFPEETDLKQKVIPPIYFDIILILLILFEHFLEKRLLNMSTPNFLFGLEDSPSVFIAADLKLRRLTFLSKKDIWVLKHHDGTKYDTFLSRLIGSKHIKLTKTKIQKLKVDLNNNDLNIDVLYELTLMFNDNLYF